ENLSIHPDPLALDLSKDVGCRHTHELHELTQPRLLVHQLITEDEVQMSRVPRIQRIVLEHLLDGLVLQGLRFHFPRRHIEQRPCKRLKTLRPILIQQMSSKHGVKGQIKATTKFMKPA